MTNIQKIRLISFSILCGLIIAAFWSAYQTHFHAAYPYNTFLFRPDDRFMDFFNAHHVFKAFTYIGQDLAIYFPFTFLVFYPLSLLSKEVAFIVFNVLFVTYIYYFIISFTQSIRQKLDSLGYHQLIITTIFLSYPFIYCFDRGNLEIIVFIFLSFSIVLFSRKKYALSAVFLAFATGMKLYPAIFALLYVKEKRYKELALYICFTAIITAVALCCLHGGFSKNLTVLLQRTQYIYNDSYMMAGVRQSSSLMATLKILYVQIQSFSHVVTFTELATFVHWVSPIYSAISFILIFVCSIYISLYENIFWKQLMILTLLMILLPAISFDYKLIHIFIPLALFFCEKKSLKNSFAKFYLIMFALLLIPKNYYIFSLTVQNYIGDPADLNASISVFANTLIIISFLITIVIERASKVRQNKPDTDLFSNEKEWNN